LKAFFVESHASNKAGKCAKNGAIDESLCKVLHTLRDFGGFFAQIYRHVKTRIRAPFLQVSQIFKKIQFGEKKKDFRVAKVFCIGTAGFEPATLWSQTRCSTGLSHVPNDCKYRQISKKHKNVCHFFFIFYEDRGNLSCS
jgi:hypothetical protein